MRGAIKSLKKKSKIFNFSSVSPNAVIITTARGVVMGIRGYILTDGVG